MPFRPDYKAGGRPELSLTRAAYEFLQPAVAVDEIVRPRTASVFVPPKGTPISVNVGRETFEVTPTVRSSGRWVYEVKTGAHPFRDAYATLKPKSKEVVLTRTAETAYTVEAAYRL